MRTTCCPAPSSETPGRRILRLKRGTTGLRQAAKYRNTCGVKRCAETLHGAETLERHHIMFDSESEHAQQVREMHQTPALLL